MPIINGRPTVVKRADMLRAELDPSFKPTFDKIQRDADPLTLGARQGLYYQNDIENPLFDICSDRDLVSLTMVDRYDPLLDIVGFRNSAVHRKEKNVITYIDAAGTGTGEPVDFASADACAPGEKGEYGYCKWVCSGFTTFKATTDTYNLADMAMKLCEAYPTFRYDGSMIDNDYEWGTIVTTQAMLTGVHRWFIEGTAYGSAETPGMAELVDFGYVDPDGNPCPAMDSTVLDLIGQGCAPTDGLSGNETVNGVVTGVAGLTLIDYLNQWVINLVYRIRRSQWMGQRPTLIGIIDPNALQCLIDCYVCHTECNGRVLEMEEQWAREMLNNMRREIASNGTVTLTFSGYPVTFFTYDYGLITDAANSLSQFFVGALLVGANKTLGFDAKDFGAALNALPLNVTEQREINVTDQGRLVSYTDWDHLCFQGTSQMDLRLCLENPWTWLKVENFACEQVFPFSADAQSTFFFGNNALDLPQIPAPAQP